MAQYGAQSSPPSFGDVDQVLTTNQSPTSSVFQYLAHTLDQFAFPASTIHPSILHQPHACSPSLTSSTHKASQDPSNAIPIQHLLQKRVSPLFILIRWVFPSRSSQFSQAVERLNRNSTSLGWQSGCPFEWSPCMAGSHNGPPRRTPADRSPALTQKTGRVRPEVAPSVWLVHSLGPGQSRLPT